jgi:hypothetical protein
MVRLLSISASSLHSSAYSLANISSALLIGKVSVSLDLRKYLQKIWEWPRMKLCIFRRIDDQDYLELSVGWDGAGLTKKGWEFCPFVMHIASNPFLRTTVADCHVIGGTNAKDSSHDSLRPHLAHLVADLEAISSPDFTLPHLDDPTRRVRVRVLCASLDGAAWCCACGNAGPTTNYPLGTSTAHKDKVVDPECAECTNIYITE